MKRILIIFIVIMLFLTSCYNTKEMKEKTIEEISISYANDFFNGNYKALTRNYKVSLKLRSKLTKLAYKGLVQSINVLYGDFDEILNYSMQDSDKYNSAKVVCKLANQILDLKITFDSKKRIVGVFYSVNTDYENPDEIGKYVTFGSEDFPIKGVLTIPEGEGPFKVLVIVHGSGPMDLDGSLYDMKPYRDIAYELSKEKIAVLRYNKRTLAHSDKLDISSLTVYEETIEDVKYAIDFLSNYEGIDSDGIYVAGHSLGGYLIPRIAKLTDIPKGYIFLSAPVSPLEDLMVEQIERISNIDGKVSIIERIELYQAKKQRDKIKKIEKYAKDDSFMAFNANRSYWLDLKEYNPIEVAREITIPMLFINGENDYQVNLRQFDMWRNANFENAIYKSYENIDHMLMYNSEISTPQSYLSKTNRHVDKKIIEDIIKFIKETK